jgi:hypothetical protein
MTWFKHFVEGTIYYLLLIGGVFAAFAVLTFVARKVLRLPPAGRYWWIAAVSGGVCLIARLVGADDLANLMFIPLMLYIVWFVLVRGVKVDDLDKEMVDDITEPGSG